MTSTDDRLARLALTLLTEPGDPRLSDLVEEIGAAEVRDHLLAERDLNGVRSDIATRLDDIDPARVLREATERGMRFLIPGDAEWPTQLDDLHHAEPVFDRGGPPLGLWVRGPLDLRALALSVAVVGARSCTSYGDELAAQMSAEVAQGGVAVVSGAAFGIDRAAHRGALAGDGHTVAVLACGVDRAYPAAHRDLLDHLARHHAVVSEAAPGWSPTRIRFLSRNRLIAALSGGTVVVEAAVRSGSLSTANWASRLGRQVMAVPGPVTSAQSEGVHELLRAGGATVVSRAAHILEAVGGVGEHLLEAPRAPTRPRDRLPIRDQQVLDAVPVSHPAAAASVARTAGVALTEVQHILDRLDQAGLVVRLDSGWRLAAAARA
ncbi:DNA-processing protein DprA [Nocardioides limicola]|uniref:DNA-processing protein DprA n=1 Tax=Nocardioides limicola TaxID=2803368 RepID=UPI00193BD345|nr:DNA-processing protein DprA [Nocardioides sp. DJM-14]